MRFKDVRTGRQLWRRIESRVYRLAPTQLRRRVLHGLFCTPHEVAQHRSAQSKGVAVAGSHVVDTVALGVHGQREQSVQCDHGIWHAARDRQWYRSTSPVCQRIAQHLGCWTRTRAFERVLAPHAVRLRQHAPSCCRRLEPARCRSVRPCESGQGVHRPVFRTFAEQLLDSGGARVCHLCRVQRRHHLCGHLEFIGTDSTAQNARDDAHRVFDATSQTQQTANSGHRHCARRRDLARNATRSLVWRPTSLSVQ